MKSSISLLIIINLLLTCAHGNKPNIILILADDLGYADLGCYGSLDVRSPNIDRLAELGVRCTDGYVSAPQCGPSRAGLITGRNQSRFGFEMNFTVKDELDTNHPIGLSLDEHTIADLLKVEGYQCALVGKWHLGSHGDYHPVHRGFDEFFGFLEGTFRYLPAKTGAPFSSMINGYEGLRYNKMRAEIENATYMTDHLTEYGLEFIERNAEVDRPFFLFMSYNAPHVPMEATSEKLEAFAHIEDELRRTLLAMISSMDDGVGKIYEKVESLGISENTLFIFLSDNGGPTSKNGSRNTPLSGAKGNLLEGGIRVPFIWSWKGHLPQGQVYTSPITSLDILPTVISIANGNLPNDRTYDGVALIKHLRGHDTNPPHQRLMWRFSTIGAVRQGPLKYLTMIDRDVDELHDLEISLSEKYSLRLKENHQRSILRKDFLNWNKELTPTEWELEDWWVSNQLLRRAGLPANVRPQ